MEPLRRFNVIFGLWSSALWTKCSNAMDGEGWGHWAERESIEPEEEAWLYDWYYYCPSATDHSLAWVQKLQTVQHWKNAVWYRMTHIPGLFHTFVSGIPSTCHQVCVCNFASILVLRGCVDGWIDVYMPQMLISFSSHPNSGGNRFLDRIVALLCANGRTAHINDDD